MAGFDPPALARRPRLLPGLPGPVRERRPGATTSRTAPGPIAATAARRRAWGEPPGSGRRRRWSSSSAATCAGLESAARPPARPRRQRDLPEPDLRDPLEPRLRHHRLRPRRRPFRRGRRRSSSLRRGDARARHPADARHRAEPRRRRSTRGSWRPRPTPAAPTGRLLHLPRATRRLRVVARGPARCRSSTTGAPACATAMYAGPDAVLRRWLRPPFSVDGWRIDVANMLGRLGPDQLGAGGRARDPRRRSRRRTRTRTSSASTRSTRPSSSPATSGTA